MKKKKSLKKLKGDLDKIFSLYIRNRDKGICFTCGLIKPIEEMQNGHFFSRVYLSTRFDEQNCHCQCVGCNVFKNGNYPKYSIRLVDKYGQGILKELERRTRQPIKFSRADYEALIEEYKSKLFNL